MSTPHLPLGPFTPADAHAVGISSDVLERLERAGKLVRIRPGLYWQTTQFAATEPRRRHALIAATLARDLAGEYALAHESAACVHALWTPRRSRQGPDTVCLYALDNRNALKSRGVHIKVSPLFAGDVIEVDGVRTTSIARTAIDLARGLALPYALIPLDSALRLGVPEQHLVDLAIAMKRWRGTKLLRTHIQLASTLSESALESAARGACIAAGLPIPELQVTLHGASGRQYRVDLLWSDARLVVEPDGIGKYGETDENRRATFQAEKRREDDLRAAGCTVLRVTWETLPLLPRLVAEHLRRPRK